MLENNMETSLESKIKNVISVLGWTREMAEKLYRIRLQDFEVYEGHFNTDGLIELDRS